jgi:hypothetical protein
MMMTFLKDKPVEPFARPEGLVERTVDSVSGLLPTKYSPTVKELFIPGTEPTSYDNIHQAFLIDKETGKLATVVYCPQGMGARGESVLRALRAGQSVISNGPLLIAGIDINGDGKPGLQPYDRELLPQVRGSDGFITPWNREAIVRQLVTETKLAKEFFDLPPISREEAEKIAFDVERKVLNLRLKFVSGPLIRELANNVLLDIAKDRPEYAVYRNILQVGCASLRCLLDGCGTGIQGEREC